MKILCLTKSTGGLAIYNERLATRLAAVADMRVEVACLSEGRQAYAERLRRAGLRTHEIDMPRYSISVIPDMSAMIAVLRLLRGGAYDVVVGQGTKAGFLARVCGRIAGVPSIYNLASLSFEQRTQGSRAAVYRSLEKLGSRFGGTIVTVCNATRDAVIAHRITTPERVIAIHTGIDLDDWAVAPARTEARVALGLEPDRFTIGWAARMNEQKDPHRFLDAIRLFREEKGAVQFVMAGDGPLRGELEQRVKSESLPLVMLPWQDDVRRFLGALDVFVLTSRWEGLPLAMLEAMALRRAVVVTPVDGTAEVVRHGIDGMVAVSAQEIADQLTELAYRPENCAALGEAARARIESSFNIERMIDEWVGVLRSVVAGGRSGRPATTRS